MFCFSYDKEKCGEKDEQKEKRRVSDLELLNDHFKLPIFYNEQKMKLNETIIKDLELSVTTDPSCTPLYMFAFNPKTNFGKKIVEQIPNYYTTDTHFLKDTQKLLENYKPLLVKKEEKEKEKEKEIDIIKIWDEIKNDNGFVDKYNYINWETFEYLNKSELFLQIMSIYNLASPILSLCTPLIMLIIPFFIIKIKGLNISINEYTEILKSLLANHAIGKLFTTFNTVDFGEKMYILLSAAFYVFTIYQNILSCIKFNQNMIKIHTYLNSFKIYIENTENSMKNLLLYSSDLKSYKKFNEIIIAKINILSDVKLNLEKIKPYSLTVKKFNEFGKVLKQFYDIYISAELNDAFLYSFGFNGYIDNLEGLSKNIKTKHICMAKFTTKKKANIFKDAFYPALIDSPIKNSVKLDKNIIITGPNASGKTTILKTTLINVIITQQFGYGFYSSAVLKPYNHIHCYLNIPDTSGRDSLFQAEARRCKEIIDIIGESDINKSKSKSTHFCVFDELYSGTNPEEAVLSATAFLKYLIKYKNVNCILTTHFIELCTKLDKNNGIKNFHMDTKVISDDFEYTYKLKKGISDVHGGIKVLNDMNYPKEIIDDASKK